MSDFLSQKGDHKNLIVFQKSQCIYDVTCYFVEHYLPKVGDRTVDQMKQAARSGKQNITRVRDKLIPKLTIEPTVQGKIL